MANKPVPEWLNSSLWSSTPSTPPSLHDEGDHRFPLEPTTSPPVESSSTIEPPPVLVPPPVVSSIRDDLVEPDVRKCNGDDDDDDIRSPSAEEVSLKAQLMTELTRKVINMRELRRLASQGVPDGAGIRSAVWKLLLMYLPSDRALWSAELAKKRSQYENFKEDILMNPSESARRLETSTTHGKAESMHADGGELSRSEICHGEHPLSLGKTSIWNKFFQDTEIIEQIDRDVKRTHPDMQFFSADTAGAKANQEALRSILIIFAKLNPGIKYVQGMNEILAPLFYVFKNDPDEENAACAEADTFFCFVELLSGFRDHFCQQLDNSVVGIRATISKLSLFLKEHDEELWRHLDVTTKVNPQFYAFRWITLLLTQEFNFADILHI